jgi:predicted transcriptional regulator
MIRDAIQTMWTDQEQQTELSMDDLADALSVERRRLAIARLNDHEEWSTSDLAETIATSRYGTHYSTQERKREYVALYQTHLPALDDLGIVDFEGDRNIVRRGSEFETSMKALDALHEVVEA